MNLLRPLVRHTEPVTRYTLEDYANQLAQTLGYGSFGFQGSQYPLGVNLTNPASKSQPIGENFHGYVTQGLRGNGVVSTLELIRVQVFSQARFRFRRLVQGRPGELFGTAALSPLENEAGGTNSGLLARVVLDADLAGNFYGVLVAGRIVRLRPDWVDTVYEDVTTPVGRVGHRIVAYLYWPDGQRGQGVRPSTLYPNEVAHFAPYPDPLASWRGMSWLTPVVREVMGDLAYTRHKLSFIDNAATPNLAVTLKESVTPEQFEEFVDQMDAAHRGPTKSGKTLYLGGGADVTVVGADMAQLDFKAVQGAGESRIAAAAGVGAVIAQFSEGMQGSSLNAGNYAAARRRFADVTMRHLWQEAAGAFASVITVPGGSQLWYDAADISFLQEDAKDAADILSVNAATIGGLVKEGFTPESAIAAVAGQDMTLLVHTGLVSVQLQPPGTLQPEPEMAASSNGSQPEPVAAN
jgi:hypothetical protein